MRGMLVELQVPLNLQRKCGILQFVLFTPGICHILLNSSVYCSSTQRFVQKRCRRDAITVLAKNCKRRYRPGSKQVQTASIGKTFVQISRMYQKNLEISCIERKAMVYATWLWPFKTMFHCLLRLFGTSLKRVSCCMSRADLYRSRRSRDGASSRA